MLIDEGKYVYSELSINRPFPTATCVAVNIISSTKLNETDSINMTSSAKLNET